MKRTLCLLFLLPLIALSQSTTWRGANNRIWPSFAPSTLIIDKNGTNSLTVNNVNVADEGDTLIRGQQQGTNTFVVWPDGSVSHNGAYAEWGDPINTTFNIHSPLLSYVDAATDPITQQQIFMVTDLGAVRLDFDILIDPTQIFQRVESTGTNSFHGYVRSNIVPYDESYLMVFSQGGPVAGSSFMKVAAGGETPYIQSRISGEQVLLLSPASSASATTYILDTSLTHTSGNLLGVLNNATNKFNVTFDGKIKTDAPTGGTAGEWRLGTASAGTFTADQIIEIQIGGTVYQIPARVKP